MMLETLRKAIGAGIMVGLAAILFISQPGYPIMRALLFSLALFFICALDLDLFTGKIGWFGVQPPLYYLVVLAGNTLGIAAVCLIALGANPGLTVEAGTVIAAKTSQSWFSLAAKGILCGCLMYLAVASFKKLEGTPRWFGIFFAIPCFILSGFEHSIADAGYMVLALQPAFFLRFLWIALFNGVGSICLCRLLESSWNPKNKVVH